MPVRSIKLQQNGVTVYTGQGDRSSNVCVHLELHQVNITDSSQSCSFSGRVTDELHSGASRPFLGQFTHGATGPRIELHSKKAAVA